jgi:DUF177 domain-containing protein
MRIELDSLAEQGSKFSRIYQPTDLALDDRDLRLGEPAEVRGRIRRKGGEVELRGELRTTIEVPCDRCLKSVQLPVDAGFVERFVPSVSWRAEEQHELQEEELNLAVFDGEAINLDDVVREEILLAIPDHVLCHEDCKGLCPDCGADRNVSECGCDSQEGDSRWEALKDLQF